MGAGAVRIAILSALGSVLAGVAAVPAQGSPLEDSTLGGAVFTGPVHGHASAMYINPAALGFTGRGWHLHLGGSLRLSSLWVDRRRIDADSGAVVDGPSVSTHTLSPGGIAAWYASFQDNAGHFGLSLYVPSSERFPGGDALRYHSLGGHFAQGQFTAAGSYRFAGRFLLGLGFSLGYTSLQYRFARDTATAGGSDADDGIASDCGGMPCGFENPAADQIYDLDVATRGALGFFALENVAASIGAAFRVHDDIWVSLSYAGLPGAFGELDLEGDAAVRTAPRAGPTTTLRGDAEILVRTPHTVYAGLRMGALPGYDFVASLRWQDLSRHDQLDVRLFGGDLDPQRVPEWFPRYRGFSDVWRLGLGLEGDEAERVRLGGRLRFETGAVGDRRITPIQAAGASLTAATGAELRLAEHFVVTAGYDLTWFLPQDSVESDFDPRDALACIDSSYDFDRCQAAREGRALPTAAGRYQRLQHGFILSLRYDSL